MHIVLIESNFSGVSAIEMAFAAGYQVTLLTHNLNALVNLLPVGSEHSLRLANEIVEVDTTDVDKLLELIQKLPNKPDAVLTFSQPFTSITAQLAKRLGLRGACPAAVEIGRNKSRARGVLSEKGVDNTKFKVCAPEELMSAARLIGFPLVVKPNKGQGSLNVKICDSIEDVLHYQSNLKNNGPQSISSELLVEEFLDGPLFSIESFTFSKESHMTWGISDRVLSQNGVEVGASFPIHHPMGALMIELAHRSLDAIGFDFGPSHVEVILTPSGPKIVELNLRVGGSGMTQIMDRALDRSICLDIIRYHCGESVEKEIKSSRAAAWFAALTQNRRTLLNTPTQQEIDSWGMDAFWLHKKKGVTVGGIESNFSWIAQTMASGVSPSDAMNNAKAGVRAFLTACGFERENSIEVG